MATNKNAVLRYNTLDKCFSNFGRKYYFDDLLEIVNEAITDFEPSSTGIKTRQLRDDIRFMKSEAGYSAPIVAHHDAEKKHYYWYEDKDFSIHNSPLNDTEAEQLRNTISILQRFEGAPQFEWMNEIGPMLSSHFKLGKTERKVMAYDSNVDYTGYDYIQPIFNAIVNKRVLKISYKPFNKEEYSLSFHPHFLKQYNNRWFAFGLNEELDKPACNLALDRILSIEEISSKYIDSTIDWEEHFYDIIGVTTYDKCMLEEIELIFTKEEAKYVTTKPLHPSQRAKELQTDELQVIIKVIPNYELETKLLSYGENVKVIRPESIKQRIAERLKQASKNYL